MNTAGYYRVAPRRKGGSAFVRADNLLHAVQLAHAMRCAAACTPTITHTTGDRVTVYRVYAHGVTMEPPVNRGVV